MSSNEQKHDLEMKILMAKFGALLETLVDEAEGFKRVQGAYNSIIETVQEPDHPLRKHAHDISHALTNALRFTLHKTPEAHASVMIGLAEFIARCAGSFKMATTRVVDGDRQVQIIDKDKGDIPPEDAQFMSNTDIAILLSLLAISFTKVLEEIDDDDGSA